MQFKFATAPAASTAMVMSLKFCSPLNGCERSGLPCACAALRGALLFVGSAVGRRIPFAGDLFTALWIPFYPSFRAREDHTAVGVVPTFLIGLRLCEVLPVVAALIGTVLFSILCSPLATVSTRLLFVLLVILAPFGAEFIAMLSVVGTFGQRSGNCTSTTTKSSDFCAHALAQSKWRSVIDPNLDDQFERQYFDYCIDAIVPANAIQNPTQFQILSDAD